MSGCTGRDQAKAVVGGGEEGGGREAAEGEGEAHGAQSGISEPRQISWSAVVTHVVLKLLPQPILLHARTLRARQHALSQCGCQGIACQLQKEEAEMERLREQERIRSGKEIQVGPQSNCCDPSQCLSHRLQHAERMSRIDRAAWQLLDVRF